MEVLTVILDLVRQNFPLDERIMITRKSFFIRWLLISDEEEQQEDKSVIDIEHIQSGNNQRVSSLEEANLWMREIETDSLEKTEKTGEK